MKRLSILKRKVILVDLADREKGLLDKKKAHTTKPSLHRAFTCFIFDQDGRVLIQKRSKKKLLWPLYWDASCSSHPFQGESYKKAAERRLKEELGTAATVKFIDKFEYHAKYRNIGEENEICAVLVGRSQLKTIKINKREVAEVRFVSLKQLSQQIKKNPRVYTPWLRIVLKRMRHQAIRDHYRVLCKRA